MRSTQMYRDHVGAVTVSTVLVEPFGYYETAIMRRGQAVELVDTNISDAAAAGELHRATVAAVSN